MSNYLKLTCVDESDNSEPLENVNHYEFRNRPFANSEVFLATIENFKLLTKGKDVKRVYNLKLQSEAIPHNFLPGDTIGILPRNNETEVENIFIRLNVDCHKAKNYVLEIRKDTTKKNATLPKHIPKKGILKDIFMYYVDIRKPPKKLFLKALIPFTTDSEEIQLLKKVCAPDGSKEYGDLITGKAQTLLGLFDTFSSCNPPLDVILEHSLPLQPRYYSISSAPLRNRLEIIFFVVDNNDGTKGICTGWLEDLITTKPEKIPIYFRQPNNFRIPVDLSTPILMIATGTGIAPFVGFLDHRLLCKVENNDELGEAYLYYGCRYAGGDFLYQTELKDHLKNQVLTKLITAFSRDTPEKWYVQDEINKNGEEVVNYILREKVVIYVCGDTKTMVKGVKDALIHNLVLYGHLEESAAKIFLNELVKENRFIVDCW